ncbi:pentatricopeptide repeat-containing protein at4g21880 mitochondrial [Phtheirospermum japonicum]|uniref:Pentatricopeptide repeat-containing protein at4g21880 mitochondrial n=1 Tax=Phtheirospermum japonicum TaxID=374723 RepID=A0A830C1H8_9LAMI|nr:pentatricopeptide repeat-containing protein at4g21880 mitochondrial [Phtheirospermum japonicum]
MRPSAQNLASLLRTTGGLTSRRFIASKSAAAAAKKKKKRSSASTAAVNKPTSSSSSANDADLKEHLSNIKFKSSSSSSVSAKRLLKQFKAPPSSSSSPSAISNSTNASLLGIVSDRLSSAGCKDDDGEMDLDWDEEYDGQDGNLLNLTWLSNITNGSVSVQRKEVHRMRKQKFVFTSSKHTHIGRLVKSCGQKLGSDATIAIFGKLGKVTGVKEFNSLIRICIQKARVATDEDVSVEQIKTAFEIFKVLRERGFKIEEETYGQFLMYLGDCGLVEEFFFFADLIREENPDSLPRLAYYEMLLWIRVNNEEKIQELCCSAAEEKSYFRESVLMALCESDRREEFSMLLETLDITKVSPIASIERVFRSLGKLLLEPYAEKFLLVLKGSDIGAVNISNLIIEYAISIPNLAVEDIIAKSQKLHSLAEVSPTSAQYEKLVAYCCGFFKVHEALDIVDEAFGSGIDLSLEAFHSILDACYRSCEFNLVHQINSRISHHNVKPNDETIRKMILLYVKMKDFEGAYGLINDLPKMDVEPTPGMYNTIMAGYFREKKIRNAINVLKQMEDADVKPNALTYSYLINNCHCEKDIFKFFEDMSNSKVQPTKHVFMALINAYASCGLLENAKQVILDKRILVKDLNEVKSVLIEALAEKGELSDATKMYEEIKEAECNLSPRSIRCLIEHFQSEGELNRSLQLLEDLNDSPYWDDACFTVISHCVRHENLRCAVDLLKQLKDKYMGSEVALEVLFDEAFCLFAEKGSTDMQFGLDLLQAIKEELGVRPSRKSLDFLLAACVSAKDSKASFVVWKEYETASLPYNVLSFVRMYQALLASGDNKSAAKILTKIRKDDPHVCCVVKACDKTYIKSPPVGKKQKKKKKALMATLGLMGVLEAKTK